VAEFYKRLWHQTRQVQILLIALSLAIAVLAAAPLYFQQTLVNGLAYGTTLPNGFHCKSGCGPSDGWAGPDFKQRR
jgi:hypothetical protein